MELKLTRHTFTDKSTIGSLSDDGGYICHILEDTDRKVESNPSGKIYGKTAIPRGRYKIVVTFSNRFKRVLPLLMNVPGFEGIRIHTGNKPEDTEGCLIPGSITETSDWVANSRYSYSKVEDLINSALAKKEEVWITIA